MPIQFNPYLRTLRAAQIQFAIGGTLWLPNTSYILGSFVFNNSGGLFSYRATTGGTSAASGTGPTGTGSAITDGTVIWQYSQPLLKVFSGAVPANCAASDPSGLLATIVLPAEFVYTPTMTGVVAINGNWSAVATGSGTAASFRIYALDGTCGLQGNCTTDLVLNNNVVATGETITVASFTVTEGNA